MRNGYEAEGVGGGGTPPIHHYAAHSKTGHMAIYYEYVNPEYSAYRGGSPAQYNLFHHELVHTVGISHHEGFSYGFSDHFGYEYMPNVTGQTAMSSRGEYEIPTVMMKDEWISEGRVKLQFLLKKTSSMKKSFYKSLQHKN